MSVKIKASITKEDRPFNGLNAIAEQLVADPKQGHYVVAYIKPVNYEVDAEDGTETPKVRFVRIEPCADDDAKTVQEILERLYTDRTGGGSQDTLFDEGNRGEG